MPLKPLTRVRRCLSPPDSTVCIHRAEAAVASRVNLADARSRPGMRLPFLQHSVQFNPQALGSLPLTGVGHAPARHITVHRSHAHIDQGVGSLAPVAVRRGRLPPTVLEHRAFALWLLGVGQARPCLAPPALAA